MSISEESFDELVHVMITCDCCGTTSGGYDHGNGSVTDLHLERGWDLDRATGRAICPGCQVSR
jgi:hypothetical protein